VEKYGRAGQTTGDNMAHAKCMLDNKRYKHTLRICNTYSFSPSNNGYKNAPQYYALCTLPVFYTFTLYCLQLTTAHMTFRNYPFRLRTTGSLRTPYLHCLPLVRIARFLSGDVMQSRVAEASDTRRSVTPTTVILQIHFRIF